MSVIRIIAITAILGFLSTAPLWAISATSYNFSSGGATPTPAGPAATPTQTAHSEPGNAATLTLTLGATPTNGDLLLMRWATAASPATNPTGWGGGCGIQHASVFICLWWHIASSEASGTYSFTNASFGTNFLDGTLADYKVPTGHKVYVDTAAGSMGIADTGAYAVAGVHPPTITASANFETVDTGCINLGTGGATFTVTGTGFTSNFATSGAFYSGYQVTASAGSSNSQLTFAHTAGETECDQIAFFVN